MKILVDAIGIHHPGGGRTSILNMLLNILSIDKENQYDILLSKREPSLNHLFSNVIQIITPVRHRLLVRIYTQYFITLTKHKYDLIHFTKNLGIFGRLPPNLVTIHDMTTILHPELVNWIDVIYWKTLQRITVQQATRIITVSNDAAKDIARLYRIPQEKIRVVYHGVSDIFRPVSNELTLPILKKFNITQPYILHVGRIDRKKNLITLIKAFKLVKDKNFPSKLVLVGEEYEKSPEPNLHLTIKELALQDEVIFTGRVSDEDLPSLYSGAMMCVFPSKHEGFGLVALEALKCGTPLIVNQTGALKEVVGDAGFLIPNLNPNSLATAIIEMLNDEELRNSFRVKGLSRSQQFTWRKSAEGVLEIYREIGNIKVKENGKT